MSPAELPPDGRSHARVVALVRDGLGAPMAGVPVSLSSEEGQDGLSPSSGVSDESGRLEARFTMPLLCQARRIHLVAELEWQEPIPFRIQARQWLRVRRLLLTLDHGELVARPGSGEHLDLEAVLEDEAGERLPGVKLRAEVVEPGAGTIAPEVAVTDGAGRAAFTYSVGNRPALVPVRVWPEAAPRLAREAVVDQSWPHFDVRVSDHPEEILIRVYTTRERARRADGLGLAQVDSVQVLHRDGDRPWEGTVSKACFQVAALVARIGCTGDGPYRDRAVGLREIASVARSVASDNDDLTAAAQLAADADRLATLFSAVASGGGPAAVVGLMGPGADSLMIRAEELVQALRELEHTPSMPAAHSLRARAARIAHELRATNELAAGLSDCWRPEAGH